MATTRVLLDTRGKSILELFTENLSELGKLNKSVASADEVGSYDLDGEDQNVNINYPTAPQTLGTSVDDAHKYFVREIEFPDAAGFSKGNFLSQADADVIGTDESSTVDVFDMDGNNTIEDTTVDTFSGRGTSITDALNADSGYTSQYKDQPQNFMKLKSRKSLFTLLQETWGVFFDETTGDPIYRNTNPLAGNNETAGLAEVKNKYKYSLDYMANYYNQQGSSFVDPPNIVDIYSQSMEGFVLGQILGGVDDLESTIATAAENVTRDFFEDMANTEDDLGLSTFYNMMRDNSVSRVSQLYVAGWGRPQENYLTKKPLQENLQQNLLLPPANDEGVVAFTNMPNPLNMPGNTTGNGTGTPGYGDNSATFTSLYTRNRAGAAGGINASNPIYNNGVIAGTSINLLQEPEASRGIDTIRGEVLPAQSDRVPFSFEKDDAQYLTYERRSAGFTTNGPAVNVTPSAIEPAVKDLDAVSADGDGNLPQIDKEVVAMGNGQYFPFTFSTVNRADGRFQVCFLQAIINTLSESYTPTWASKHFFGRSEQTHTYTFTDRTIDISFTVFANEMRQLQNVYERVLWLAQQCYPEFDNTGRMATGPIVALRVGDLFQYKTGVIRSLSYDWLGFAGGKWEMTSAARMPQGCVITLNYQIIHDSMPTRDTNFYHGPGGGLDAATTRYRTISGNASAGGDAFDPFSETETTEIGYGQPFLDSGQLSTEGSERDYLASVRNKNRVIDEEGVGGLRQVNRVPVGRDEDTEELIFA